ncbi:hypothetical protein J3E68DRAFT_402922 [Trichoderma sp. SZMC 28012]
MRKRLRQRDGAARTKQTRVDETKANGELPVCITAPEKPSASGPQCKPTLKLAVMVPTSTPCQAH